MRLTRSLAAVSAFAGIALGLTSAFAPPLRAQSLWLPRDIDRVVMLEMLRPTVEGVDGEIFSAAYFLGGRFSVGERIALVGEVPFARFDGRSEYYVGYPFPSFYGGDPENSIGNPYFGVETRSASSPIFFELGIRAPLASGDEYLALLQGERGDRLRWNAFRDELLSVQAAFNVRETTPHGMTYRFRVSPVWNAKSGYQPSDLWAHYSFGIGYSGHWARIGTGFSGTALLTQDYGNLGTRTSNQFDVQADFLGGAIRPGLGVRVPLGSAANAVPVVFGVTLAWAP